MDKLISFVLIFVVAAVAMNLVIFLIVGLAAFVEWDVEYLKTLYLNAENLGSLTRYTMVMSFLFSLFSFNEIS